LSSFNRRASQPIAKAAIVIRDRARQNTAAAFAWANAARGAQRFRVFA
jgi:hypothetical protein